MTALTALPARAGDADGYKLLRIDGHTVKWGSPKLGRGAVVTWRIAFDQGAMPGQENCRATSGFDRLLERAHLSREDALRAADTAFALWSKAANIRFVPAGLHQRADITLTAQSDPDGIAFTDVTPGGGALRRATVCFNPQAAWTIAPSGTYRLAYVMAHEIGHAIGLDHPGPSGTLMSFEYDADRLTLTSGDMAGVLRLYGPAARIASR